MADLSKAYNHIFDESSNNVRKISHFFTQRKITESQDALNPTTLERTKKEVNFTNNFLALVLPKDETSSKLCLEIYGNKGYCFQGEITSYTEILPHILIPLNDDKEIFVNIYKPDKETNEKKIKYLSFIHVPKRYQSTEDDECETKIETKKQVDLKVNL